MMEEWDWHILQVLYEQKNITKTAQTLFVSQPAITARIQKIENEFGITLVYRGNKGVNFTPQGEYLAKFAIETLANMRQAKEQIMNMEKKVVGTLRIGASNFFTKYKLPRILRLFRDVYPDVEYKVTTTWSSEIFNLLNKQEIHVGFIRGEYTWDDEKYLLFDEPIVIASQNEIHLANLPNLPRIDYRTDPLVKATIDNWWRQNYSLPPKISMEVNTVDTCREMVLNGLGYAIMPGTILDDVPAINQIDLTNKNGEPLLRRTWMICQKEQLALNIVKTFVDFVKNLDLKNGRK